MSNFGNCVTWVLRLEDRSLAGKIVGLGDGAGLTRFGITSKNNMAEIGEEFFSSMPTPEALEVAKNFYQYTYWTPLRCGSLQTDVLAATLLSFAVNDWIKTAVQMLQAVVGVAPDGVMGPATLAAIAERNEENVAAALREAQERYYEKLLAANSADERFRDGWIARARVVYPDLP